MSFPPLSLGEENYRKNCGAEILELVYFAFYFRLGFVPRFALCFGLLYSFPQFDRSH
jgi:hypothetical protein